MRRGADDPIHASHAKRGPRGAAVVKAGKKHALGWCAAALAVGLLTPSLVIFCLAVFVGHIGPGAALADVLRRQFAEGDNLFLLAAYGLIPFVALCVVCLAASRRLSPPRLACVALGGLAGILAIMIPAHVSVWAPLYGEGDMSSTAVIAFVFIPFLCAAGLVPGVLTGWLVSLLPAFRRGAEAA